MTLLAGQPMVLHVARTLEEVADEVMIAVAQGKAADYLRVLGRRYAVVEDSRPEGGPLVGIIAGFEALDSEYVMVSPCDTPLVLKAVCELTVEKSQGRDGAVPVTNGFLEPLHGCYRRDRGLRTFRNALRDGRLKLQAVVEDLDLVRLDEESLRLLDPNLESFWNVNTPAELKRARELMAKRRH